MFRVQLQVEDGGTYRIRQVTAPALIASCGQADRGGSVSQLRPVSTVNNAVCRSSQQQMALSFYLPPDDVEKL